MKRLLSLIANNSKLIIIIKVNLLIIEKANSIYNINILISLNISYYI